MGPTVRHATADDVPALEIIRRQAIEAAYASHLPRERYADLVATPDSGLPERVGAADHVVLVSTTEVTPTAFIGYRQLDGELVDLYTSPDYERRGHATTLLDALVERIDGEELCVWAPSPVEGFFLDRGFEPTGEARSDPLPARRLSKRLTDEP